MKTVGFGVPDRFLCRAQKKTPPDLSGGAVALGDDLLSHLLQAVPSARPVLTSLFGMGRGVPRRYCHRNISAPLARGVCLDIALE